MTKFITTNDGKFNEFSKYDEKLQQYIPKEDVPEVIGNQLEIILHKLNDFQRKYNLNDFLVEDSTFEVYNKEKDTWETVIDIKYRYEEMQEETPMRWVSFLAYYKRGRIHVYKEKVRGVVDRHRGFSFYNSFCIIDKTVRKHIEDDTDKQNCARTKAFLRFLKNDLPDEIKFQKDIESWEGEYQSEE